jgi:hypothetical protein
MHLAQLKSSESIITHDDTHLGISMAVWAYSTLIGRPIHSKPLCLWQDRIVGGL